MLTEQMQPEQTQPIPVENGWPLLGILPKLLSGDPFEYLKNVMLEKGDFVQVKLGPRSAYLVSHPDYVKRILQDNHHNYRKPDMIYNAAKEASGNGLATSSGELWLRQRRMIQPYLHRKALTSLFSKMTRAVSQILSRWTLLAERGTEIEFGTRVGEITMNVTVLSMFGEGLLKETEVVDIGRNINYMLKYVGESLYSIVLPKWFPVPGRREFIKSKKAVRKTVNYIIDKCRQNKEEAGSLIQMLINAVDEESQQKMSEQQLFDEVMTIFVAGYESTTATISWLGVAIDRNPEILQKLQAEVDQVLGGRIPTFEDIPRLTYTRQVFLELLRMYTIAPLLPRELHEADSLGNHHLPANSLVLVFYHGVHHNPHVWKNPEVFDPERFSPENTSGRHAFAYVPFSAGPRKCAGDEFALLEGTLIIAMLLQKYNIHVLPGQTFTAALGLSMRPQKGVKVRFSKRAPG